MLGRLGRALAHCTHSTRQPDHAVLPSAGEPRASTDTLASGPAAPRKTALLPPSALGIAAPKVVRVDMTELTHKGDMAWFNGHKDEACKIYEKLAERYVNQPLPIIKLMVAYDAMGESRGLKVASDRCASLFPNAKEKARAFLALFGDRPSDVSADLLGLRLERGLRLGGASRLGSQAATELLQDHCCDKKPILYHAVERGNADDLEAVLALIARAGFSPALVEQKDVALTMAEGFYKEDKLQAMLRSGIVPSTQEHTARLIDKALADSQTTLLQVLFETFLDAGYAREVNGEQRNLAQLLLLSNCSDQMLGRKMKTLAMNHALPCDAAQAHRLVGLAMERGFQALVSILDNGIELEARDPHSGNTLLIAAAARGAVDSVGVLLGRGASTTATNEAGLDAADMARVQGFAAVEKQMRQFPAQQRFDQLISLLWGDCFSYELDRMRTNLYALDGDQLTHLLSYVPPLLGLGALPDNFASSEMWTRKSMRARRLPALDYVEKGGYHWRSLVRRLVLLAGKLTNAHWQVLTGLMEGLKEPSWSLDTVRCLDGDKGLPPGDWKAVAQAISGPAYTDLKPPVRVRIIDTAVEVKKRFGQRGLAALDWLNHIVVEGFDGQAYWSVMYDFVLCSSSQGDCAGLAAFAQEDYQTKNKLGLRRSVVERVARLEKYGERLRHENRDASAQANQAPGAHGASAAASGKGEKVSQTFTAAYQAMGRFNNPRWVAHADASYQPAIAACLDYFGSATEMASIDSQTTPKVLSMLITIFGYQETLTLLHVNDVESRVRKMILRWHPDKVTPERAEVAEEMTTLLLTLRDLLSDSELRQRLTDHLDAEDPERRWRSVNV